MIALDGLALVPGRAAGLALVVRRASAPRRRRLARGDAERDDILAARRAAEAGLRHRLDTVPEGPARQILRAHLALLSDPLLTAAIEQRLDTGLDAETAVEETGSALAARF